MEEDNQAPKQSIFSFLYGEDRQQRPMFHRLRLQLLRSMGWRTRVTREECEQVQLPGDSEGTWHGLEGLSEVSNMGPICPCRSRPTNLIYGCGAETAPN